MKLKSWKNDHRSKPGYLLIEGLVSVVMSVLAICMITVMISCTRNVNSQNVIHFHSYLSLLESDRYEFEIQKCDFNRCLLYSRTNHKPYKVEQYQDMIRLTGSYKGHMPLLPNIRQVRWCKDRGCLRTDVTFENGQKCSSYSKIPFKKR